MLAGELYRDEPALERERMRAKRLCHAYNQTAGDLDRSILAELFGYETDAYLEPPFYCDYGYNLRLGRRVYANHNLVVLDCVPVTIGDNVLFGPNVVLSTATYPVDPSIREQALEYARPIAVGINVWLGAGVIVLPGVEIGANTTVGAGSVVTRSLPANCVAVGNPCRVVRDLQAEGDHIRDDLLNNLG